MDERPTPVARSRDASSPPARRGLALREVVAGIAALTLIVAVTAALAQGVRADASLDRSLENLRRIGVANVAYAVDWNDRQFTKLPDDFGVNSSPSIPARANRYMQERNCLPSVTLGWLRTETGSPGLWGFWVTDQDGRCLSIGTSSNAVLLAPGRLTSDEAYSIGLHRFVNETDFRVYADEVPGFYRSLWFAPGSARYDFARAHFDDEDEFFLDAATNEFAQSTYSFSPAAMFDPDVFRPAADGGFQDPLTLTDGFMSPTVGSARFPDLKTRVMEHEWFRNAPSPLDPSTGEPWLFNQSITARPATLFFDGSIAELANSHALVDDAIVRGQTGGVDGLWSRDTPLGPDGVFGDSSLEGFPMNHHLLTTDGIRGRDLLSR